MHIVTPLTVPPDKADRALINLHGGGFTAASGSLIECVPIANLTKTRVIAILYRLAPEDPFPAAVDDAVVVYRELLKTYKPEKIAIYGSAVLTLEAAVQIRQLGLPLPGDAGSFFRGGDFTKAGDLQYIYRCMASPARRTRARRGCSGLPSMWARRTPKSSALTVLHGSARHAAHAVHDQHPRHAPQRHDNSAPRFSARGRACAACGLRWAQSLFLVQPETS
jgi:acetyl esterase/lipase